MSLCTVCDRVINHRLLMCARHWRMVPPALQKQVYATHAESARTSIRDAAAWGASRKRYHAACDAAAAAVQAQLPPPLARTAPEVLADLARICPTSIF